MTSLVLLMLLASEPAWFGIAFDSSATDCARIKHVASDSAVLPVETVGDCLDSVGRTPTPNVQTALQALATQVAGQEVSLTFRSLGKFSVIPTRRTQEFVDALCREVAWLNPTVSVDYDPAAVQVPAPANGEPISVRLWSREVTVGDVLEHLEKTGRLKVLAPVPVVFSVRPARSCGSSGEVEPARGVERSSVLAPDQRLRIRMRNLKYQVVR